MSRQRPAPRPARRRGSASCGVHVIGHGLESEGTVYCCDHCASRAGVSELRDRA